MKKGEQFKRWQSEEIEKCTSSTERKIGRQKELQQLLGIEPGNTGVNLLNLKNRRKSKDVKDSKDIIGWNM